MQTNVTNNKVKKKKERSKHKKQIRELFEHILIVKVRCEFA